MLDDWTTLPVQYEAPLPSLLLFLFPASSAAEGRAGSA
jgi:hypothetical protein